MAKGMSGDTFDCMAAVFRILAEASRLAILCCLMEGGQMSVGQIVRAIGRNQATVSKHLKLMAELGLLARRKQGLQVFYWLQDPVWEKVFRLVRSSLNKGMAE
jgi:DNA-binding transcriptional ArsR family regulator